MLTPITNIRTTLALQMKLAQARAEGWAEPNALPAWLERFSFDGDLRFLSQFK